MGCWVSHGLCRGGACLFFYDLWTRRKHTWKLITLVIYGLNNALACHLCTDVAVPYFSVDSDTVCGTWHPSLWFQLISSPWRLTLLSGAVSSSGLSRRL